MYLLKECQLENMRVIVFLKMKDSDIRGEHEMKLIQPLLTIENSVIRNATLFSGLFTTSDVYKVSGPPNQVSYSLLVRIQITE